MSQQPSPASPTDTSEKIEFGGINLLIGIVIGLALQLGWWALLDRLQLRTMDSSNNSFLTQLLVLLGQPYRVSLLGGAILGAVANLKGTSRRSIIGKSARWGFGFAIAFYLFRCCATSASNCSWTVIREYC